MYKRFARVLVSIVSVAAAVSPAWALSIEEEVRLGRRAMEDVRSLRLTPDPALSAIGERLSSVVERQDLPWRFWVIEDMNSFNAFAAPGGIVFITRTYYEKLSEDEAAFVIGHEMGHVDLHHFHRTLKRQQKATIGHVLLNLLIKGSATTLRTATDIGATAYMTHYSRALEKEADFAGYRYAEAAGYNARMAVTALSKLGEQPHIHPWIVNIYSTHPILSSREDRLAAMGGEEPDDIEIPGPSPDHTRDLAAGLAPFDPPVPIAVRILAPEGGRWEHRWRKNFTKHLHLRLTPLGFSIAADDIMYKPDIGDPLEAARSRDARYLLLVTVHAMESVDTGEAQLEGTPVQASIGVEAALIGADDAAEVWGERMAAERTGVDVLPVDPEILYTDTCVGALAEQVAGQIAIECARSAGAQPAGAETPAQSVDAGTEAAPPAEQVGEGADADIAVDAGAGAVAPDD
jgi:Zn-dependent protease with chaperone function